MNNDLDKKLNREALVISKEYSGHVAIPTIVLSLLVVLIYSTVLFLFATKHLSPLLSIIEQKNLEMMLAEKPFKQ